MTLRTLAKSNIKNKPHRAYAMAFLTAVVCASLFLSSFVIFSLKNGVNSLSKRMGADLILVPEGYDSKITGAILRGEPNTFFLEEDVLRQLSQIPDIEYATPQLFIATLSASCCSYPIQVIGIDTESDFVVLPWLRSQVTLPIERGRVIVGANIVGNYEEEVKFFKKNFKIHGRLTETGMGFDNSVFMSLDSARELAREFKKLIGIEHVDTDRSYSSIMIKVKAGTDPRIVQDQIKELFQDRPSDRRVYVLMSKQMMSEVASNMTGILRYLSIQMGVIWILALGVLSIVYSFSIKERKKEIAMLQIIGATKNAVKRLLFTEVFIINASGAIFGCTVGVLLSVLFSKAISLSVRLPFLAPSATLLSVLALAVLMLGTFMGPISAFFSIRNMMNTEIQLLMREND